MKKLKILTLDEWMMGVLSELDYTIFKNYLRQNKDGEYYLQNLLEAKEKLHLSQRQMQKASKRIEAYARWYEVYVMWWTDEHEW